MDLSIE